MPGNCRLKAELKTHCKFFSQIYFCWGAYLKRKPKVRKSKKTYRIPNRSQYNKALVNRGNLTVWISDEAIKSRYEPEKNVRWKAKAKYHRRSLAETGMFRYKQTFGEKVASRKEENQFQEMRLNCRILNIMTHQGMPNSKCIVQ